MFSVAFNSMFKSVFHKLKHLRSSYLVHICIYIIAAAALHDCVTLTYMSRLTDFGVCHCFKAFVLVLMGTFDSRELILGQIA